MMIQFHKAHITDDEISSVAETLRGGWLTMGTKTIEFEKRMAAFAGVPFGLACNSCTAALHMALKAVGVGEGDEVIVPAMTFVSSANVVVHLNAKPVFVDVDRFTHLIKSGGIERCITPKTKALVPVHYAGQPCDMDEINAIAQKHRIPVIDDAAHAFPAWYRGTPVGSHADITCLSFYATKTLTTGEGGMALLRNGEWHERMVRMRLHGIDRDAWKRYSFEGTWQYDVNEPGYKYNMTDINAAIGLVQLDKAEWMLAERTRIAERYTAAFSGIEEIIPYAVGADRVSAWHLYPVKLDIDRLSITRDRFIEELKAIGIFTSVHFIPLYRFSYYSRLGYRPSDFPDCDWAYERMISLPIYPGLMPDELDYIINGVSDLVKRFRR